MIFTFFFISWQCGVWETLLTALEILIRVHHPHQVFNIRQFLKAEIVHRFLLTCQVLQVDQHLQGFRSYKFTPQRLIVFCLSQGASGRASDCHHTGSVSVIHQNHSGGARFSSRHGAAEVDLQLPAGCSPSNQHLRLPHSSQFLLLTAHWWGSRMIEDYKSTVMSWIDQSYLLDGKLYQEKVQSIMYLRHSSSGGKSTSSSVVSLSPTVFTDAPHEST